MNNQRQKVCCFEAKACALVIGCFQTTVYSMIATLIVFGGFIWHFSTFSNQTSNSTSGQSVLKDLNIPILVIIFICCIIGAWTGYLLITGIYEQNAKKLKIWLIVHLQGIILISFSFMAPFRKLWPTGIVERISVVLIGTAINAFFAWVVNVNRQEILAAGNQNAAV